ncbi:hypothetical protein EJB05_49498 [Eragrostis curvula]|uniref:Uncharacterized protein n=1 Tax=Eragrostis curvula TaxID=38414 RepID=A0A5J9T4F5_9POAL|nr:hypothetical protein EJB05_49498 [Eragrostis curvula]
MRHRTALAPSQQRAGPALRRGRPRRPIWCTDGMEGGGAARNHSMVGAAAYEMQARHISLPSAESPFPTWLLSLPGLAIFDSSPAAALLRYPMEIGDCSALRSCRRGAGLGGLVQAHHNQMQRKEDHEIRPLNNLLYENQDSYDELIFEIRGPICCEMDPTRNQLSCLQDQAARD